jgi:tetratricopeptide (TPR) repeat protein
LALEEDEMRRTILIAAVAAGLLAAVLFAGTLREAAVAAPSPEAERLASQGLELQQRARVTGNPALYPRVERTLRDALELDERNAVALRGLAALAAGRHRFAESLELARTAQRLEPQVAAVYGLIGDASLELGHYRQAFAAFDRMAALKPSAAAYARVSYARELRGDLAGALEAMELAIDAAAVGEPAAWSRTLTGRLLLSLNRVDEADIRFREALAFVDGYPQALAGRGDVALARGDEATAIALYRRAATGSPIPDLHGTLGDLLAGAERRGEAERAWQRAEQLERLFARHGGRNLLETAEFDLNHDRNIRSALDRARRGQAERPSVEGDHVLAWALYKNGLCAEARTVSLRSFRLGTLDVDGLYHHALIERCLGNGEEAKRYVERVEALAPGYLETAPSARRLASPR